MLSAFLLTSLAAAASAVGHFKIMAKPEMQSIKQLTAAQNLPIASKSRFRERRLGKNQYTKTFSGLEALSSEGSESSAAIAHE
jgi:hypothetical protein